MIIKTDAAAVTLKRSGAAFNNDSININGKVPSLDSANAGYKGAGSMNTPFAVALSSSERNGFAAAALTAFNDRLPSLKQSANGYAQVLSDYFCDSEYALEKSQCSSSVLATSIIYGYGANIVAARMGSSGIYRYKDGNLSSIGLVKKSDDDHVPFSSCELIENVTDGELFVLCSGGVFSVLQEEDIVSILAGANGSAKRAAQGLTAAALSKDSSEDAVSVIVLCVFAQEEPLVEPILPVTPEEAAAAAAEITEPVIPVEQPSQPEEPTIVIPEPINNTVAEQIEPQQVTDGVEAAQVPKPEKTNTIVKKILIVILIICGMVALTFATYKIAGAIKNRISGIPEETTLEATTVEESTTQEATTQADTTDESESTTANETTTYAQVFNPSVNTTTRRAPATRAPATRAPATRAPATQAPATQPEATTAEPSGDAETTTGEAENTTGEAEGTTGETEANVTGEGTTADGNATTADGNATTANGENTTATVDNTTSVGDTTAAPSGDTTTPTQAAESTAPQSDSTQAAPTEAPTQASTLQTTLEVPLG